MSINYAYGRDGGGRGFANRGGSPELPYHNTLVLENGRCTECGRPRYRPADKPRAEPGPCFRCAKPPKAPAGLPDFEGSTEVVTQHEPDVEVLVDDAEIYGQCIGCSTDLYKTGKRGRPAVKCPDCRAGNPVEIYLPDITPLEAGTPWNGCRSCGTPIARAPGAAGRPRAYCEWCLEADT